LISGSTSTDTLRTRAPCAPTTVALNEGMFQGSRRAVAADTVDFPSGISGR
jgi:hypothetical protein